MDFFSYTDIRFLWSQVDRSLIPPFVLGVIYGGLFGAGVALKKWWLPVILLLLPAVLAFTSLLLPSVENVAYRIFFLSLSAVAVIAFAYWLAR